MKYDFSGYATRVGLKCLDGRTIAPGAFKDFDGKKIPLVWMHQHGDGENVLGHAILEARKDGIYAYGFFNETKQAQDLKLAVQHGDIEALSIYANKLKETNKLVHDGKLIELSLVLAGANPGAFIDNVVMSHGDEEIQLDEAVIYSGLELEDSEGGNMPKRLSHADEDTEGGQTIQEVFDSLNEQQRNLLTFMIQEAASMSHSADDSDEEEEEDEDSDEEEDSSDEGESEDSNEDDDQEDDADEADSDDSNQDDSVQHSDQEGTPVTRNIFEGSATATDSLEPKKHLTHSQVKTIIATAVKVGSFKEAVLAHAADYGIENIEELFPDAKTLTSTPEFIKRQTDWVAKVMAGVDKRPFAKIRTWVADITQDEARAKGYIKGNVKKEEFFRIAKRSTEPTTIYKKQKLDRDDIIDITEMDVVAWLWAEMRLMWDEEAARAIMFGDGREWDDEDKINEDKIRPICNDADMYATQVYLNGVDVDSISTEVWEPVLDQIKLAISDEYKGTGQPTLYAPKKFLTRITLIRDRDGKRLYRGLDELASDMDVAAIVPVDAAVVPAGVFGVVVNLSDYSVGTNPGGQLTKFDDFDIDVNQLKYLLEGRFSGALTKYKSAVVLRTSSTAAGAVPAPVFDGDNNTVTIPASDKVQYLIPPGTFLEGNQILKLKAGEVVKIKAAPLAGVKIATNQTTSWTFTGVVAGG